MRKFNCNFNDFQYRTVYITNPKEAAWQVEDLLPAAGDRAWGLDIETGKDPKHLEHKQAGLNPSLSWIRLVQIYDRKNSYVFDLLTVPLTILTPLLRKGKWIGHNSVFELSHFKHAGVSGLNIGCSMLLSQMIHTAEHSPREIFDDEEEDDEDQTGLGRYRKAGHSLDAVVSREFGVSVDKSQQDSNWNQPTLTDAQVIYAGLDAVLSSKLGDRFFPKLKLLKMGRAYKLLHDMQSVVSDMQLEGMPVDWAYHARLMQKWDRASTLALKKCKPFFGDTNIRSGKQMSEWLTTYLAKKPELLAEWPKTPKGAYAFSKTVVTRYQHLPAIAALLGYTKWGKLISTYGEKLAAQAHPYTNRLHTSYTLGETRTGRMSSKNPNIQNFPSDSEFRNMFAAPAGYKLVIADFSQIELRLQAEFSQDPVMLQVYKTGGDIYCTMASFMFGRKITKDDEKERKVGKVVMLALGYGMGAKKLMEYAENAGITEHGFEFWKNAHKTYHTRFRVYSQWCHNIRRRCEVLGYGETIMGKRRRLEPQEVYTTGPNLVIQGSASALMQRAMLLNSERLGDLGRVIGTVHDEVLDLCLEKHAKKVAIILESSMNDAMKEMFPRTVCSKVATAVIGDRWGDIKSPNWRKKLKTGTYIDWKEAA